MTMRFRGGIFLNLIGLTLAASACQPVGAQAALLLEGAGDIARTLDPTGHDAIYFARICAASPTRLRRCGPDELGVVISRYKGIAGYDWLAVPLTPYLYSVERASQAPVHVNGETVEQLRWRYHDKHLTKLGDVPEGGRVRRGWNQLVGASYERRIYALRFDTTAEQDDALIAELNGEANRSHFNILFRNCADFASEILDLYFPRAFQRHLAPDAGITTPRQVAYELVRYARRHPEIHLTVFKIPQIPGYRRPSRVGKSVSESLILTGDVVPLTVLSPIAGAVVGVDALVWGRFPLPLKQARVISPADLTALASWNVDSFAMNPSDAGSIEVSAVSPIPRKTSP
jgi:hypothetical protein